MLLEDPDSPIAEVEEGERRGYGIYVEGGGGRGRVLWGKDVVKNTMQGQSRRKIGRERKKSRCGARGGGAGG